ncbi:MAG: hypothetical protein HN597_16585 [Desulfobacula sp.]|jgi:hypothetical protein|uniref:hypothetical protein n=1 Tax=Desulfobacula sp. TaxID=2593537 RepID=UPI0039B8A1C8|nr:hypothetical protein [Desulfobacula sp.]
MKKSHSFNELSDKVCQSPGCEKKIKQRLVLKKADFDYCYKHWSEKEFKRRRNLE